MGTTLALEKSLLQHTTLIDDELPADPGVVHRAAGLAGQHPHAASAGAVRGLRALQGLYGLHALHARWRARRRARAQQAHHLSRLACPLVDLSGRRLLPETEA